MTTKTPRTWILAAALTAVTALGAVAVLRHQLPPIFAVSDYRPLQATQLYDHTGVLVGTLATERRTLVPFSALPPHVVHAFLAAEDADFYAHEGIDWPGVVRAVLKNLRPGAHVQGASTITQQTVKALVLGPERSLWRKVREAVLARRLEQLLPKDEILQIYLNQIYFGSGAWGIEQAAQTYFGKPASALDLAEGAMLAAAPKNPSRYTLRGDLAALKQRQRYVLRQMLAHGWTDEAAARAAMAAALPQPPAPPAHLAACGSYVEDVRRLLVERVGEERVLGGGLRVYLGLDARAQVAGAAALRQGVEDVARSHGYLPSGRRLEVDVLQRTLQAAHQAFAPPSAEPCLGCAPVQRMWDFSSVPLQGGAPAKFAGSLRTVPLAPYERAEVPVVEVRANPPEALVDLGSRRGRLPLRRMAWARSFDPSGRTPRPRDVAQVLHPGDLVTVDVVRLGRTQRPGDDGALNLPEVAEVALVPPTRLEGALVAIDPHTRAVRALLGSVRPEAAGGFNRATQARRQPGSAFKPIIYAAGLLTQSITPASICNDAPVNIVDPWTGAAWRPENFEDGRYDGPMTYRHALAASKNTCSVRLLQRMGPQQAIAVARALGAVEPNAPLPNNLTLALGTGEVTPLNLTAAMATLAANGAGVPPQFVRRVLGPEGEELWDLQSPEPQQMLPAQVAYVLTDMLRSVVEEGTARRARALGRPLAGKTGTSQASRDVWFTGYAPQLAATVWLGFDDNASLGRHTGSSAALPAWQRFMGVALAGEPAQDFVRPAGVVSVRVDDATGEPTEAPPGTAGSRDEVFVAGTEPTFAGQPLPSIFLEDAHPDAGPPPTRPAVGPAPTGPLPPTGADADQSPSPSAADADAAANEEEVAPDDPLAEPLEVEALPPP